MIPRSKRRRSCSRRRASALVIALAFSGCTCAGIAGPDAQLTQAALGFQSLSQLPCGLSIQRLQVSRITPEPELIPPHVVFSFDLDGRLGGVAVSALGVEKVPMVYDGGRWQPRTSPLPRLEQTLAALRPLAGSAREWLIRVDVDKIEVTQVRAYGTRRVVHLKLAADGGVQLEK